MALCLCRGARVMVAALGAPRTVQGVPFIPDPVAPPLTTWISFDDWQCAGRYAGIGPRGAVMRQAGTTPVLLTAPHAVAHTRDGARKGADVATGGLTLAAALSSGARALIATGFQDHDGNRVPGGPFKDALAAQLGTLRAVIDVHGMRDEFGVQVCLGTGSNPPADNWLLALARAVFTAAGFTVALNDPYGAMHEHSVTSSVTRTGVPALQVEFAASLRRPREDPTTAGAALAALAAFAAQAGWDR